MINFSIAFGYDHFVASKAISDWFPKVWVVYENKNYNTDKKIRLVFEQYFFPSSPISLFSCCCCGNGKCSVCTFNLLVTTVPVIINIFLLVYYHYLFNVESSFLSFAFSLRMNLSTCLACLAIC